MLFSVGSDTPSPPYAPSYPPRPCHRAPFRRSKPGASPSGSVDRWSFLPYDCSDGSSSAIANLARSWKGFPDPTAWNLSKVDSRIYKPPPWPSRSGHRPVCIPVLSFSKSSPSSLPIVLIQCRRRQDRVLLDRRLFQSPLMSSPVSVWLAPVQSWGRTEIFGTASQNEECHKLNGCHVKIETVSKYGWRHTQSECLFWLW